jgi:tRNA/rRNA methyltransferase
MASGATEVLNNTKIFGNTLDAVSDLNLVLATTARIRDLSKTVLSPKQAADWLIDHHAHVGRSGILFGPERAGLVNDDIVLADAVINVPLNPNFSSLNLAQAVLLVGYEWFQNAIKPKTLDKETGRTMAAKVSEREYFYERLESELDKSGFLYPDHLAPTIKRNLRSMFNRTGLTQQEVRTLHGILTALINPKN